MGNTVAKTVLCLVGLIFCTSCSSSDPASPVAPSFEGSWGLTSVDSESGVKVYSRLDELTGEQDGYMFDTGGKLLVRNFGWCATPPYSYSNLEGSWTEGHNSNLLLVYPQWEEMHTFRLEIVSLSEAELRCRIELIE